MIRSVPSSRKGVASHILIQSAPSSRIPFSHTIGMMLWLVLRLVIAAVKYLINTSHLALILKLSMNLHLTLSISFFYSPLNWVECFNIFLYVLMGISSIIRESHVASRSQYVETSGWDRVRVSSRSRSRVRVRITIVSATFIILCGLGISMS